MKCNIYARSEPTVKLVRNRPTAFFLVIYIVCMFC